MTKKKKKRKKRVKNGELTQLANGHWQGRVAVGRTENGPMYQTITRESKEELEALVLYQRLLYDTIYRVNNCFNRGFINETIL